MFQLSFFSPEEVWPKALEQAEERQKRFDAGQGRGKRRKTLSMATDIYQRTVQSRFDVAMSWQFGGTVWHS